MAQGTGSKKLPTAVAGRKKCVAHDQPMTIVGIPDVVVVKAVRIDLELTIVHVDVRDKQERNVECAIYTTSARC